MRNLLIGQRLFLLIFVQLVIIMAIVIAGYLSTDTTNNKINQINQTVTDQATLSRLGETVRSELLTTINNMYRGTTTWEEASASLSAAKSRFEQGWQEYFDSLLESSRERAVEMYGTGIEGIREVFAAVEPLFATRDRARLSLFVTNDLDELIEPYFVALNVNVDEKQQDSAQILQEAQEAGNLYTSLIIGLGIAGAIFGVLFSGWITRSITNPVNHIAETVHQVAAGNYDVRTDMVGADELAELGQALDRLLQERVASLVQSERENEMLNDSVISLLQAVSQLSQRDLTVKVPVTEDVTGPVADALNLLTGETAKVLLGVTHISEEVASASDKVKAQSDTVIAVANNERHEVEKAASDLAAASEAMNRIAELARACDEAAEQAIKTTQVALETVTNTVSGINNTRDTIRETEKRIKRLGERSQEISGVVNLINTIAERTHILALNASMHAASAGEAGRGFAVVADEVQRLAENAREATSQIATLVSNIQTETADTVNAMNMAISQVVEGSRLAEQAGEQMKETQQSTAELVAAVQQIAQSSQQQAQASTELLERARQIQDSTQQTSLQLQEQTIQTNNLVEYAKGLLNSVRVFKLPAPEVSQ